MICLFGYLALMMFHKWTLYSADAEDRQYSERCAPSLLITFINMVLFSEQPVEEGCDTGYMFAGQKHIQRLLVVVAVCCVPIMLFAKPLAQRKAHNARAGARSVPVNGADGTQSAAAEESFDFSEVMILQGIHTIEYVLGSVSHTASYLRLWALSLAHAQLSEVLWVMVLRNGLNVNGWYGIKSKEITALFATRTSFVFRYGGVILWVIFSFWALLTVSVLCLMEGLSAFLHTLRLHWVEFQSKFYKGEGHLFIPFSFEAIIAQAEADQS